MLGSLLVLLKKAVAYVLKLGDDSMPKKRKVGAQDTTISVKWSDKNRMRRLAKHTKTTKTGKVFEPDSVIFSRVLKDYMNSHPNEINDRTTSTYPSKIQDESQQG